jgi:hypothetical protein
MIAFMRFDFTCRVGLRSHHFREGLRVVRNSQQAEYLSAMDPIITIPLKVVEFVQLVGRSYVTVVRTERQGNLDGKALD